MRHETQGNTKKLPSISQVIERHLQTLLHETGTSMKVFTSNVRDHYERIHSLNSRAIEWSQFHDPCTRMARDAEKFKRWLESDTGHQLPIDLYESIIAAFPEDRRFRLQIELLARQGMIPVPRPSIEPSADLATFGNIAKQTGETLIAISKLLEDGTIDRSDKSFAPNAMVQIDAAIAALVSMQVSIRSKCFGEKV